MRRIVIRRGSRSSLSTTEWCERHHRVQMSSVSINKMFASRARPAGQKNLLNTHYTKSPKQTRTRTVEIEG